MCDGHSRSSYAVIVHDHERWLSYTIIMHDSHMCHDDVWRSFMFIVYDRHMGWASYRVVMCNHRTRFPSRVIYDDHCWRHIRTYLIIANDASNDDDPNITQSALDCFFVEQPSLLSCTNLLFVTSGSAKNATGTAISSLVGQPYVQCCMEGVDPSSQSTHETNAYSICYHSMIYNSKFLG